MWTAMSNNTDKKEDDKSGVDGSSTGEIAIHTPQQVASSQNRTNNEIISTAPSNSNKENNALILHSPILSLLPNSNIKVCFLYDVPYGTLKCVLLTSMMCHLNNNCAVLIAAI